MEDIMKIDLKEKGIQDVDWICLAQNRCQWRAFVNTTISLQIPQEAGNLLTS
jgi:hypothetical protein